MANCVGMDLGMKKVNSALKLRSFISSDKLPCLKEEIMAIEKKKEGKGKIASIFYNYKEWDMYCKYAFQSKEYFGEYFENVQKGARVGTSIGLFCGVICTDQSVGSMIFSTGAGTVFGGVVGQFLALPKLYTDFKKIKSSQISQ